MAKRGFNSQKNPPPAARFECRMPDKPDDLSEYQGKMWDKYSAMFFRAGVLDEANGELLRLLCEWLETKRDFTQDLNKLYTNPKTGEKKKMLVHKTKAGGPTLSPYERGLRNATLEVMTLLDYFGATPKTRDRVHTYRKEVAIEVNKPEPIKKQELSQSAIANNFEQDTDLEAEVERRMQNGDM